MRTRFPPLPLPEAKTVRLYHRRMSDPKSLGRYQVRGVLGKGAMGLVYDGYDAKLKRRVAIKTIQTSTLDEATARHYEKRFRREVRAVARLNHPHIVQMVEARQDRKSTRLNSSHPSTSYAVFCLKK